jgi:two-component system, OmpR family, response regulator BaeR
MKKLLVIDDIQANLYCEFLERAGFEAVCFELGSQALEWLKGNKADLILLDLALPEKGLSGMEVGEKIRKMGIKTKILFITGKLLEPVDFRWAAELDAEVIEKPMNVEDFLSEVKQRL